MQSLPPEGFIVVQGPFSAAEIAQVGETYDLVFARAKLADIKRGSTSVRFGDLLNQAPGFEPIYTHPFLLAAAEEFLGPGYRMSAYHARTVLAGARAQKLHQDAPPDEDGFPLLGFIFMVDDFRDDNGATRFVPGSEHLSDLSRGAEMETASVAACGGAGSMIVFNGAVWHGHGPNLTASPRRSIQGAFVRSDQQPAVNHARTMSSDIAARLSPAARQLLFHS